MDIKKTLKYIKLHESTVKILLGIFLVFLLGFLLFKNNKNNSSESFVPLNIGDITPNLTSAYPKDEIIYKQATPTINPDNTSSISTEAKVHSVVKGEDLWSIAEYYYKSGYNWVDIAKVNNIKDPNRLNIGQILFIPNIIEKTPTIKEIISVGETNPISGATYAVEKGDNLWNIAVRAYGDGYKWMEIAKENKLVHPNIIHPGNFLNIPR